MERWLDRVGEARALLIAGPTASGKSGLALDFAEQVERGGRPALIVNADSMQVYDALRVLTARPTAADEQRAQHRLYGHVVAGTRYSAGQWLRDAGIVLADAAQAGALPIIVGGTGLYFSALTEGLSAVPAIPASIRHAWSEQLLAQGAQALHSELMRLDPRAAAAIRPSDPRRIGRALEVLEATGKSLLDWQDAPGELPPLSGDRVVRLVVEADRAALYARIEARFDAMVEAGVVEEVGSLLQRELPPGLPILRAIGVKPLAGYLRGDLSLDEAVAFAKLESRRYAKRQMTWFRNRMADWDGLRL
jgi:tRNA dimethylallyltransferase